MKMSIHDHTFGLTLILLHLCLFPLNAHSLRCYVCNDCEIYYNETQLIDCDKDEKCIKLVEAGSGMVSRDCGDKKICSFGISISNSQNLKSSSTLSNANNRKSEKFSTNFKSDSRSRRSPPLLSPEIKTTPAPPLPTAPPISSLHCCDDEDGCNKASTTLSSTQLLLTILLLFLIRVRG